MPSPSPLTLQALPRTPGPSPARSPPTQVAGAANLPRTPVCFPQFLPGPSLPTQGHARAPGSVLPAFPRSSRDPQDFVCPSPCFSKPPGSSLPSQDPPWTPTPSSASCPRTPVLPMGFPGSPLDPRSPLCPPLPLPQLPSARPIFGLYPLAPPLPLLPAPSRSAPSSFTPSRAASARPPISAARLPISLQLPLPCHPPADGP